MLEIIPVGGFSEIGRNCCVVNYNGEMVMLDLGLEMENYVKHMEDEDVQFAKESDLVQVDAVPDVRILKNPKAVKAICVSHAHLDHVGGIPFVAHHFDCPIHASAFTIEFLKGTLRGNKQSLKNKLIAHPVNSKFQVTKNIEVEFINITHSTPQTVCIAVHTPEGTVLYVNDFKLDGNPVLGPVTNSERLRELKVKCLIMDSLYAPAHMKCPSESIAREMLKDVLLGVDNKGRNVIVATFSSHIARVKSIIQIAKQLGREPVFLGRSLINYTEAAKRAEVIDLTGEVKIMKSGKQMVTWLKSVKKPEQYLFISTGHQGEPKAVLSRIVNEDFFALRPDDHVVFSCNVIPSPTTMENRAVLERKLKDRHVRMFKDIHVSGHAHREDHRDLVNMVKPEHVIPTHGNLNMLGEQRDLLLEMGYKDDKIHILHNGQSVLL
ncbi:MAG: MBL fold metallo-hydrolase [Candidatus Woesearchaeota archaeon]